MVFGLKSNKQGGGASKGILNNRRLFIILLAIIIIAVAIYGGKKLFGHKAPTPEEAAQALSNTFEAETYRFTTRSTVYLDQAERLFCQLEGEKSGNSRHIMGEVLGTPINIYYVDEALYQQSSLDRSWRQVAEANLAEAQMLLAEITPEANFNYREVGEISYIGEEEIEGENLHRLEFSPVMADNWIEKYFDEIHCVVWLDGDAAFIVRAEISAVSAENPGVKLVIENTFEDFGEPLEITAPL